jgi:ketosteroid isomerase-like protein
MLRNAALSLAVLCAVAPATFAATDAELREQVRKAETAFAKSMADRDHAAFVSHLAEDTIFLGRDEMHGKKAVAEAWKDFYQGKDAPFSWRPERVVVLPSGDLALSTGPVFAPDGRQVGQFNSTWRKEKDGSWKVVFDNGCQCRPICEASAQKAAPAPSPSPQ